MHIFKNNSKEDKAVCSSGCGCNGSDIDTNKVRKPLFLEGKPVFKILGSGCRKCHDQYDILQKTISELNIDAEIEYITYFSKSYGIWNNEHTGYCPQRQCDFLWKGAERRGSD